MNAVLSVDLACKNACDLGICLLQGDTSGEVRVTPVPFWELGIVNPLVAPQLASSLQAFCTEKGVHVAMLDGPQGWKDPQSPLPHCRLCEVKAGAPAKTGTLGNVKPRNYTPFVEFSIAVFAQLLQLGTILAKDPQPNVPMVGLLALESLPLSGWRSLGLKPLPAKKKARQHDIDDRIRKLGELFDLRLEQQVSHDELQATVSGLAGLAVLSGDPNAYVAVGCSAKETGGVIVEGFIFNPRRSR